MRRPFRRTLGNRAPSRPVPPMPHRRGGTRPARRRPRPDVEQRSGSIGPPGPCSGPAKLRRVAQQLARGGAPGVHRTIGSSFGRDVEALDQVRAIGVVLRVGRNAVAVAGHVPQPGAHRRRCAADHHRPPPPDLRSARPRRSSAHDPLAVLASATSSARIRPEEHQRHRPRRRHGRHQRRAVRTAGQARP